MADTTQVMAHAEDELQRARWASSGNVLIGLWLIAAPFVLAFEGSDAAQWNHIIVGAVVAVFAMMRATSPDYREGLSWANVALGVWMIAAPFVLGYSEVNAAQTNSIVTGAAIIALGAFSAYETYRAHEEQLGAMSSGTM